MPLPYLYINININLSPTACVISGRISSPPSRWSTFWSEISPCLSQKKKSRNSSSWWLHHPLWKVCSSKWEASPKFWVNKKKYLKPPPSLGSKDPRASSQSPSSKHFTRWWHRVTSSWTRTPRTKCIQMSFRKISTWKKTYGIWGFFLLSIKKRVIHQTF